MTYRCPCGASFDETLGKYGCPNCCGESGPALSEGLSLDEALTFLGEAGFTVIVVDDTVDPDVRH